MKKMYCLVAICISLLFSGPAFSETVRLATGEWQPFTGKELPDYGLHAKKIKTIFTEMGYDVEFVFMPWKRAYEMTRKGDFVASFTWSKTQDRAGEVNYPENLLSLSKEVGFYKKSRFPNGLDIKSLADIKAQDLRVVGISSYWYEAPLKDYKIKNNIVSSSELAWKIVNGDRADLMIENIDVGKSESQAILGAGKDAEFGVTAPLKTQQMYLIFSKSHPKSQELMKKYDAAVSKLKAEGKL